MFLQQFQAILPNVAEFFCMAPVSNLLMLFMPYSDTVNDFTIAEWKNIEIF